MDHETEISKNEKQNEEEAHIELHGVGSFVETRALLSVRIISNALAIVKSLAGRCSLYTNSYGIERSLQILIYIVFYLRKLPVEYDFEREFTKTSRPLRECKKL